MSKSQRARGGGEQQAASKAEPQVKIGDPLQGPDSNAYMASLIELAAEKAGAEDKFLSLAAHETAAPGQFDYAEDSGELGEFDYAEDGDRKTQEDALPELRGTHVDGGYKYEDYEKGKAFVKGAGDAHEVDPNDAKQGSLGDCYLIAAMAAVARANPQAIMDLIKDNGDGTFDVTLYIRESRYSDPKPVTKTVDARLASKSAGVPLYAKPGDVENGDVELWTALIEKTVAQHKGSYDKISGGNIAKDGFAFNGATELLTGKREGYFALSSLDEDDALLTIDMALDDKKPVTCDTANHDDAYLTKEATKQNVYWNHAYAPISVDLDARTIDLQNPWGSSHVDKLTVKDFFRFYRSIRVGA